MAIPERLESISTNLPNSQLTKVVEALRNKKVEEVPGTHSLVAESRGWKVNFEDATYKLDEFYEEINSVALIAAKPEFIEALIKELETELSGVVDKRNYDKAKKINDQIQDLTGLIII